MWTREYLSISFDLLPISVGTFCPLFKTSNMILIEETPFEPFNSTSHNSGYVIFDVTYMHS